jgi:hypothetical protein
LTSEQIMANELDKEIYLRDVEKLLRNYPVTDKGQIIVEIGEYLENEANQSGLDISRICQKYKDKIVLINLFLAKKNLILLKPKGNTGRNVLLGFLTLIIIGVISILLLVKSFLPIFKIDDVTGNITLFGGEVTLNKMDQKGFFKDIKSDLKIKLEGDIPLGDFEKLNIISGNSLLNIEGNEVDKIQYTCNTDKANPDMVAIDKKILSFKLSTNMKCNIKLPKNLIFNIQIENGLVNLKNIEQNFSLNVENGLVKWGPQNFAKYQLNSEVKAGAVTHNDVQLGGTSAPYSANILINAGSLILFNN